MEFLGVCRGEVVEVVVGALGVVPVDPEQGLGLDVLDVAPGAEPADELGLVGSDRGLGQGVVVGVADAADWGVDTP